MKESVMIRAAKGQDTLFRPGIKKDTVYWEKRQKNNEAARRSRERRRNRVLALESHLQELKKENEDMRAELAIIKRRFGLPVNVRMIGHLPPEQFADKISCSGPSSVISRVPAANHSVREMLTCPDTFLVNRLANQDKIYLDPRQESHQSHESNVPLCLKREVSDPGQNSVPANLSYPQIYIRNSASAQVDYSFQVKKENIDL